MLHNLIGDRYPLDASEVQFTDAAARFFLLFY